MENNKKENLKIKIEEFINEKLEAFKKELVDKENDFSEEIGEIEEFKNLSDVEKLEKLKEDISKEMEQSMYDFSEEEVHKLELDLEEMEEHIKEVADDIKLIDDILKIKCKVNNIERMLVDEVNCNIKPILLLNIALITPLNLKIVNLELNDYMESIMDIVIYLLLDLGEGKQIYASADVGTLCNLGLMTAVNSLFEEIELNPIEFRGITKLTTLEELEMLFKN